ncbi:unnamed protein product [Porites lobata]|uniref:Uncharacterized protein n=1 Tax=Porites lobata TaxID=104759 RepID=A0ABN8QFM9_9CNID|nr:unnamed protein product [Porites lobata]
MKICCAASLMCFLLVAAMVSSSVVPAKRTEKGDVTDHAQKVDDVFPGNLLPELRKHLEMLLTKVVDLYLIKLRRAVSKEKKMNDITRVMSKTEE